MVNAENSRQRDQRQASLGHTGRQDQGAFLGRPGTNGGRKVELRWLRLEMGSTGVAGAVLGWTTPPVRRSFAMLGAISEEVATHAYRDAHEGLAASVARATAYGGTGEGPASRGGG